MNPDEYVNLSQIEAEHWFYRGKRAIVRRWIERCHPLQPDSLLVDCGAGTGAFALEMADKCKVLATDDYEESIAIAKKYLGEHRVIKAPCHNLPLDKETVDCVTALDVLEHIQYDGAAVREFARILSPDGLFIATVPALMTLWSDWDTALHHFRRYSRSELEVLLRTNGFEILEIRYVNAAVFPIVWLARKVRKWKCAVPESQRSEDRIPPRWLNAMLRRWFVLEGTARWFPAPFGVGLLAVCRPVK